MEISTRPYLIRAMHEWCVDSGFTPFIVVKVDASVQIPRQFVSDDRVTLNISHTATAALIINNEAITFKARFGGVARDIYVPIENVIGIYASENGHGIGFDVTKEKASEDPPPDKDPDPPKIERTRSFTIVK